MDREQREFIVRADTTAPSDLSGTAFAHLDVRWLVGEARQGAELVGVGQTIYPAGGGTHEHHLHPDAEEVVIVLSGHMSIHVDRGLGPRKVMEWGAGEVSGTLPYSRMGKPPGDAVVDE